MIKINRMFSISSPRMSEVSYFSVNYNMYNNVLDEYYMYFYQTLISYKESLKIKNDSCFSYGVSCKYFIHFNIKEKFLSFNNAAYNNKVYKKVKNIDKKIEMAKKKIKHFSNKVKYFREINK